MKSFFTKDFFVPLILLCLELIKMVLSFAVGVIPYAGIPLAYVLDFCLSTLIGTVAVLLLWLDGSLYLMVIMSAFVAGTVPLIDLLPFWSGVALYSVLKKDSAESPTAALALAALEPTPANIKSALPQVDGIRARNNIPYDVQAAA